MAGMNLIPRPLQLARARSRRIKAWALPIAAAATVLVVPIVIDKYKSVEAARLFAENTQLQRQIAGQRAELTAVTAEANQALVQLQRAEALRSKRAWSAVLALVARRMPAGCWLTSIATDPAAPGQAGARPATRRTRTLEREHESGSSVTIDAPRKLRITGYATDAAEPHQFVTRLKQTAVFADVGLESSHREPVLGGSYFRFELTCEW